MEPITGLATIVGLLSDFVAEGRARDADAWDQFRLELDSKRHKRIIDELDSNEQLSLSIRNMLENNHEELKGALDAISNSLAEIVSASGLSEISNAFLPEHYLSPGALDIIEEMEKRGARAIYKSSGIGRASHYKVSGGTGGAFTLDKENQRYEEDDFNTLIDLGLLSLDYTERGNKLYHMTRNASALVQSRMEQTADVSDKAGI